MTATGINGFYTQRLEYLYLADKCFFSHLDEWFADITPDEREITAN